MMTRPGIIAKPNHSMAIAKGTLRVNTHADTYGSDWADQAKAALNTLHRVQKQPAMS